MSQRAGHAGFVLECGSDLLQMSQLADLEKKFTAADIIPQTIIPANIDFSVPYSQQYLV